MTLDVKFSESNQTFNLQFGESNQTFNADYGEIQTIHGKDGEDGKSAYEIAVDNGFEGTETEWLESLHGKDGQDGDTPVRGTDYWTAADKAQMVNDVIAALPVYEGEVEAV